MTSDYSTKQSLCMRLSIMTASAVAQVPLPQVDLKRFKYECASPGKQED